MLKYDAVCKIIENKQWEVFKELGINVKHYEENNFCHLDYDQIEAIKNHPIVNLCRGILIDYNGNVIRSSFTRFYNLGENGVDTFDFENSIVFEKADGSLMFVYFCPSTNQWEIGTRGTAFAEGNFTGAVMNTFRDFFLAAMNKTEEQFQTDCNTMLDKNKTYLFEGIGPDNRIVTKYETNHLVFLAAIHNDTGEEKFNIDNNYIELFNNINWNVRAIREYKFNTQEDCLKALGELTGLEEGFVAYDQKTGERVKIKSPIYLAAHRLRGNGLTTNAVCELVSLGEVAEYLATFPEDAHKFDDAIEELKTMLFCLKENYENNKHHESQKDFALAVKDLPLSGVIFKARKNGTDVMHEFNQFPVNKRAEWLKERLLRTQKLEKFHGYR